MSVLRWLHLSDFHQGMAGQSWLWPNVRELFFQDLEKLHALCGPCDLVLFTGDLTQRGSAEEFARFDETLHELFAHLRGLGSDPKLLVVPGNHDLSRPSSMETDAQVRVLGRWREYPDVQKVFWTEAASSYRKVVQGAFASYEKWWRETELPRLETLRHGLLPGDFSATFEKEGVRLGILGLNTAFLQLTGEDFHGRLAVGLPQFHESCGGDGPAWVGSHDACLLLTHHPPDWLDAEARQVLRGEIASPGRFFAHLFGHMHEGGARMVAEGGREPRRDIQAPSLFGLEQWGTAQESRRHGYTVGQLEFGEGHGSLRLWPRKALRRNDGSWRLVQDVHEFDLEDDQGTRPEQVSLRRRSTKAPRGRSTKKARVADFDDPLQALVEGIRELPNDLAHRIQGFLTHYVGPEARGGTPFGGRSDALSELDQWLDGEGQPPYRLLIAPGGRGKSALLAHWVCRLARREDLAVAYFPVSVRFQTNLAGQLFQALGARLAWLHGEPIPSDFNTPVDVWRRLFLDALSRRLDGGRLLLLVIDGLDEAADLALGPTLLPFPPSPGLRIVLSAREMTNRDVESWSRVLGWTQPGRVVPMVLESLDRRGISEALGGLNPPMDRLANHPPMVEELHRLTQGDPLLLGLYLEQLSGRPELEAVPEQLRSLQPGLEGYFNGWWDEQRDLWGDEAPLRESAVNDLLGALACALGPLRRDDLLRLLGLGSGLRLDETLRPVARLIVGDGQRQGIAFTHPRLATYLQSRLSEDERRAWTSRFLDWGRSTLKALESGGMNPKDVSAYLIHYYGAHLEREERGAEDFFPLVSEAWLRAVESRERAYAGFLNDVERVRKALQRDNEARLSARQPLAIAEEVRCGVVRSSIHSIAKNLSSAQMKAFISTRWWTLEEAHSYARNIPDAPKRMDALLAIVDCAPESRRDVYLHEALEMALALERNAFHFSNPLERVYSRVAASFLPTIVETLETHEDVAFRISSLVSLAKCQPRSLRPAILERARALLNSILREGARESLEKEVEDAADWERVQARRMRGWNLFAGRRDSRPSEVVYALSALAATPSDEYPDPDREHVLSQAWVKHLESRNAELELPSDLDERQLNRLVECIPGFNYMEARAYLLVALAPLLPLGLLLDAWRFAQEMEDPETRAEVLAAIVPRMPEPERRLAIEEMRQAAFAISDAEQVLTVAAALGDLLSEPQRSQMQFSVWEARDLARGSTRLYTLTGLIRFLPEAKRRDALEEVLREFTSRDELELRTNTFLSSLGPALASPSIRELLLDIEFRVPVDKLSFDALAEIAPFVPDEWLDEMWKATSRDANPNQVMSYFRALGPRLSPGLQRTVVDTLSDKTIGDGWRALVVSGLAPSLDDSLVSRVLEWIFPVRNEYQFWAFAELWPRLSSELRGKYFVDVVNAALAQEGIRRDRVVQVLAGPLAEVQGEKAIDFAEVISLIGWRALFLVDLLPYLPRHQERIIRDALDWAAMDAETFRASTVVRASAQAPDGMLPELVAVAKGVEERDDHRAAALGAIASRLPQEQRYALLEEALRLAIPGRTGMFWDDPLPELVPELCRLPREQLYRLWTDALSRLASQARPEFLKQLQVLAPVLHALGGEEELAQVVRTLLEVGRWWA
ncbi:hypothetical protein D187_002975 [Cystobacter fuscus DSM 2262]|uniref:Calcineurin-like phosphoesterase domain-containing protein n=1 Tax=Cystobacter fuscus (strain ATCC 25194 / DSM 2262 / NBRC 100088 / M29) TaxID=1242864 RepID=S9P4V7_CYSF2|nr:metallophosphoesterase [Cystobacter fuscus]EPX59485.1 hypothetical protein D187_002975 [Cystobacter fuscus DSM 2262]